jgi:hypothetical protein
MRILRALAAGTCLLFLTASAASAQVQLSLRDGRVTVVATNATVRQILAEWARVGQTTIVNVERIPGGPLTLQLTNMSEQEALDILLRSVTGYMAAPRPMAIAGLSRYDRILVLPTVATARPPASAAPAPVFQQLPVQPRIDDDDQPSIVQPSRGPLFPTFTQPPSGGAQPGGQTSTPGMVQPPLVIEDQNGVVIPTPAGAAPATRPGVFIPPPGGTAVGTPRPGMIVPPPVQPGPGAAFPGQPQVPPPDN